MKQTHPTDGLCARERPNLRVVLAAYERAGVQDILPGARVYRWQRQAGMEGTGKADPKDRQEILIANRQCLEPTAPRQSRLFG